jgi:HSP20 family protein
MKNIFDSKVLIAGLFFLLGFFSFWGGQTLLHHFQEKPRATANKLPGLGPNEPTFPFGEEENDPFEEMRRLQKQMMQGMSGQGVSGAGDVETREDDEFVYYDIAIPGVDPKNLQVTIENGQLSISGKSEQKSDESGTGVYYSSQFHRTFPVPPNTDSDKVQVDSGKDKITLKFPKKGS